MKYNEAAAEVKYLLEKIDWTKVKDSRGVYLYQHTVVGRVIRRLNGGGGFDFFLNIEECIGVHDGDGDDPQLDCLTPPFVSLLAFDYTANVGGRVAEGDLAHNPSPPENRETDWIAVSRFGGEEINTMDGFTGLSKQVIRVSPFSPDRERLSLMADEVLSKINNFTGRTRPNIVLRRGPVPDGLDFQCCLLDEVFDNNDEESGIYGMDMFFVVVASS